MMQVELNQVRHLVEDISCLFKGLDLRLMLCKKRILKNLDVSSYWEHLVPFCYYHFFIKNIDLFDVNCSLKWKML
jgi:hypothetical protein